MELCNTWVQIVHFILRQFLKEEAGNRKAELETEGSKETLKSSHGTKETFNIQKQIHMAACKSCGKSIDMNAKFCKYCGAKKRGKERK